MQTAKESIKSASLFTLKLVQAFGIFHCIQTYGFDFATSTGASMTPTVDGNGSLLFFEKISPQITGYQRGDVVVSKAMNGTHLVCKRIAALPGDFVSADRLNKRTIQVPAGHVWLMGDNKDNSIDSRVYGPVPMAMLQGKVQAALYPEWRLIENRLSVI
jgi:inner membrane protease subunit 1